MGKVCDIVFTFPEGKVLGIVVPGGRGFFHPEVFIDLKNVVKIGEDTVLVDVRSTPKTTPPKRGHGYIGRDDDSCEPERRPDRRSFEDDE